MTYQTSQLSFDPLSIIGTIGAVGKTGLVLPTPESEWQRIARMKAEAGASSPEQVDSKDTNTALLYILGGLGLITLIGVIAMVAVRRS